jgi:DNA-binding NtrC family response regulator
MSEGGQDEAPGTPGTHTVQVMSELDPAHAVVAPLVLRVVSGPDAGNVHEAAGDRVVIGTHERAELVLTDGTVSRFHCEIAIEGDRIAIRDLGSKNGTVVDGVLVVHAYLRVGSRLKLGTTELTLALGDAPVEVPLAREGRFGPMVGSSLAMRAAFALLERAAKTDATVLLTGETGCGKEIAAEAIHAESARRDGPFVIVDCGAIPSELLESELFGHEKGAFTGAVQARQGAFEAAQGGTIFLDEVGELSLELQPKLLRALERRHVKHVGGTKYVEVDVRIIAATNRSLQSEVNARRFRPDLYYRLAVIEVRLPPLRERPEDIPALVEHILEGLGSSQHPDAAAVRSEQARTEMKRHPWPGNVRELRNYVERCLAFADRRPPLGASDEAAATASATPVAQPGQDLKSARESWVQTFERQYLQQLLAEHEGNVSAAARAAGIDRRYLYRLLWRHGLR